uniref:IRG-type G domain-containing protein n=1 Tax=Panagrolaimus sp. ES5 TaxID=591445 RepID=A0AC34F2J5_9BILA
MVLLVGCACENTSIAVYNSETKVEKTFYIEKIVYNNFDTIVKFFESLKKCIPQPINFLCIEMNYKYTSEYRKKFIETAQTFGIKNVKILGPRKSYFFTAIYELSFTPKTGDLLWIFRMQSNGLFMDSWVFDEMKKWKLHKEYVIEKNVETEKQYSTIEYLHKIKEKLKLNSNPSPFICCFGLEDISAKNISKIFPFKKLMFRSLSVWLISLLNYARFLSGEKDFSKYESEFILDRNIYVKFYEGENKTFSMPIKDEEKYEINLSVDINGIHTLNLKRCTSDQNDNNAKLLKNENLTNNFEMLSIINQSKSKYNIPIKILNYDSSLNAIGIDLGTTECCVAVIRKNGPDFVVLDPVTSLRTMPSYIAFDEKEPKCGQIVVDRMRHKAKYSIFDTKRIIGKRPAEITTDLLWPFKVINEQNKALIQHETAKGTDIKSPEEITAVLLSHIKKATETYQSKKISEVVITIPSEFTEAQQTATKNSVEYAGFETIHFIPEPIAAAFAYFSEMDIPNQSNILICDCGGGTVDICIAEIANDHLSVLSYNGDSYLGGRDFDKILFNHFNAILKHKFGIDVTANTKKYILKQKCQDIKHKLSVADEDWLDVSDFNYDRDDIIKITREEFEGMTSDILIRIKNVILQAIIKAKIEKQKINYVFQVGGGCRMPMIKKMLADIFPAANHQCNLYPDWVVAHGAALYAYFMKTKGSGNMSDSSAATSTVDSNSYKADSGTTETDREFPAHFKLIIENAKKKLNLDTKKFYNIAFVGLMKIGKGSLINAIRGISDEDKGAVPVGITETTHAIQSYEFSNFELGHVKLYDIPSSLTFIHNDVDYYQDKCLCAFDCLIILCEDFLSNEEIKIALQSLKFNQRVVFVRSRFDIAMANAKRSKRIAEINQHTIMDEIKKSAKSFSNELEKTGNKELKKVPIFFISSYSLRDLVQGHNPDYIFQEKLFLDFINSSKYK